MYHLKGNYPSGANLFVTVLDLPIWLVWGDIPLIPNRKTGCEDHAAISFLPLSTISTNRNPKL